MLTSSGPSWHFFTPTTLFKFIGVLPETSFLFRSLSLMSFETFEEEWISFLLGTCSELISFWTGGQRSAAGVSCLYSAESAALCVTPVKEHERCNIPFFPEHYYGLATAGLRWKDDQLTLLAIRKRRTTNTCGLVEDTHLPVSFLLSSCWNSPVPIICRSVQIPQSSFCFFGIITFVGCLIAYQSLWQA